MEQYQLPDGRLPIRFDKGRAAFYAKTRGTGEVRYTFTMIKYIRNNRPLLSKEQRRAINKETANRLIASDPDFYRKLGRLGGKGRKNGSSKS